MNSEQVHEDVVEAGAVHNQKPSDTTASIKIDSDTPPADEESREDDSLASNPSDANCKMHEIKKTTAHVPTLDNHLQHSNQSLDRQCYTETESPNRRIDGSTQSSKSNYANATVTILGNTSDRNDFLPKNQSNNNNNEIEKAGASSVDDRGFISGVKKWFSASDTEYIDGPLEHDYHREIVDNIGAALKPGRAAEREKKLHRNRVNSLDNNNYDESLLDKEDGGGMEMGRQRSSTYDEASIRPHNEGGDGKSKFKYTNGSRSKKRSNKIEDELRVMGECSFFYDGMDNEDNHSPSHKIPGHENNATNEEHGYHREGHPDKHHRTRIVNPRAMAHAISSSARRQWTERRYRRRLKQSTFSLPQSMWNDREHLQQQTDAPQSQMHPDLPTYELTTEHRQAFLAAHTALNEQHANEYSRNKHAINITEYGYDLDIDLDLNLTSEDNQQEEIRADLTKSSLAIRGSGQIRLPIDNVRLVMDSHLQPGILSIESRAGGYMGYENYGNGNRYGNINSCEMVPLPAGTEDDEEANLKTAPAHRRASSEPAVEPWRRSELSYVLTVDDSLYRRLFQEINDSHRLPLGMYYCCHLVESEASHDHVGIGVAISILMVVFVFLVVGMLIWPTD